MSVDQLVAWGVLYYAYTALSSPLALDLNVSRLHVAAAFSSCLLVAGWVGRLLGPVLDARGTRGALRAGAIFAPLAFASIALIGGFPSLLLAFALLGASHALTLYEPAFRTIADWCPDEATRAQAMLGLTIVGGFASAVFLPFTGWLVARYGWRESVLILAGVLMTVLLPARFLLPLPHRVDPQTPSDPVDASPSEGRLATALSLHSLASTGVFVYLMWHLVERGESLATAAAIAGLAGAAQVPGRILFGFLRRRVGYQSFLPLLLSVQAAALLGVAVVPGVISTTSIFVFGAANGMMTLERTTVLIEWYGRSTLGARQGRLAAATGTARAVSPFVVEAGHHIASYAVMFCILCLALAFGAWVCRSALILRAGEV